MLKLEQNLTDKWLFLSPLLSHVNVCPFDYRSQANLLFPGEGALPTHTHKGTSGLTAAFKNAHVRYERYTTIIKPT